MQLLKYTNLIRLKVLWHFLQAYLIKKQSSAFYTKFILINQLNHCSIFKISLVKLTKECVFSVNSNLIKQIDGSPMGGPAAVAFSDIFCVKTM